MQIRAASLEFLPTGTITWWDKRPKVWVDGWRHLHHDRAGLKADLVVKGKGGVAVFQVWTSSFLASNQARCVAPD